MPSPPGPSEFSFVDLVRAWRGWKRWGSAHPDLVDFHRSRYAAFSVAFGVDLDQAPKVGPPMPTWVVEQVFRWRGQDGLEREAEHWHHEVHQFALRAEKQSRALHSPFSVYLEAPLAIIAAQQRFASDVDPRVVELRRALDAMVLDLVRALHPEAAGRQISADELRANGFDPNRREPDPDEFW